MQPSLRSLDLVSRGRRALLDQFCNFDRPVRGTSGVFSALFMADPGAAARGHQTRNVFESLPASSLVVRPLWIRVL